MPVTNIDLIRTACWISKCASQWAGDLSCGVTAGSERAAEPLNAETLQRFRDEIIERLDMVAPSKL